MATEDRSSEMPSNSSRAVLLDSFGGPEVLKLREVPAPKAGPGQIRVRVTAAGLNPMDWFMTSDAETAARFGLSLPAGFGTDYAGIVDQVGDGVTGYMPGDRVFGGALSRAIADYIVVEPAGTIAAGGGCASHPQRRQRPHGRDPGDSGLHGRRRAGRGQTHPERHGADRRGSRRCRSVHGSACPTRRGKGDRNRIGDIG